MPVYKYKSFKDAEEHMQVLLSDNPFERMKRIESLLLAIRPRHKIQKGIFKFYIIEQANNHHKNQADS